MNRLWGLMATVLAVCAVSLAAAGAGATGAPAPGQKFPVISFPHPESREHRSYLGLPRGTSFRLSDIKAEIVIVEILSMYCPFCQSEAPRVNELFAMIQEDPALKDTVKMIGIAAGNTPLERDMFRDAFDVPFPLFADGDFTAHKALGEVRTPYFFGVRLDGGRATVFHSHLGAFDDPASFLSLILDRATGEEGSR